MKLIEKSGSKIAYVRFAAELVVIILWLCVIFGFSFDNSTLSSRKSGKLLVLIVNAVDPSLGATVDNYQMLPNLENCEKILRKCAHMTEYGILALLAFIFVSDIIKTREKQRYSQSGVLLGQNKVQKRSNSDLKCACSCADDVFSKSAYAALIAEILVVITGSIDEYIQSKTPGRYGTPVDVFIDACGGAIVLIFCIFIGRKLKKRRERGRTL